MYHRCWVKVLLYIPKQSRKHMIHLRGLIPRWRLGIQDGTLLKLPCYDIKRIINVKLQATKLDCIKHCGNKNHRQESSNNRHLLKNNYNKVLIPDIWEKAKTVFKYEYSISFGFAIPTRTSKPFTIVARTLIMTRYVFDSGTKVPFGAIKSKRSKNWSNDWTCRIQSSDSCNPSHTLLPMIDSAMTDNDVQKWSGYCSSLAAASTQRRPLQGIFP